MFNSIEVKYLTLILLLAKPIRKDQDEMIYERGDMGLNMFIVTRGTVALTWSGDFVENARRHDNFGEACVFLERQQRSHSAKSTEITEMLSLSKEGIFTTLGSLAPEVVEKLRAVVAEKYKKLKYSRKASKRMEAAKSKNSTSTNDHGVQSDTERPLATKVISACSNLLLSAGSRDTAKVSPDIDASESTTTRGDLSIPEYIGTSEGREIASALENNQTNNDISHAECSTIVPPLTSNISWRDVQTTIGDLVRKNAHLEAALIKQIKMQQEQEKTNRIRFETLLSALKNSKKTISIEE